MYFYGYLFLDTTQDNSEKSIWDISNITDFIYYNEDEPLENISVNSTIFNIETENTKNNSTFDSDNQQEDSKKNTIHAVNIIQPDDNSPKNSTELIIATKDDLNNQQESPSQKVIILDVQIIQSADNPAEPVATQEFSDINVTLTKNGNIRKRRKYSASLEERKERRIQQRKEKMQLKPPCNESCRKNCIKNIPEERRVIINTHFQEFNFIEKKRFILNNTSYKDIHETKESSRRSQSIQYFFQNDTGERIQICKTFFLGTLGYNAKNDRLVLQTVSNHHRDQNPVTHDMRGRYKILI